MAAAVQASTRTRHHDLHRVTTEERLFASEYNVPPGHAMGPKDEVKWTLRGYLPPKHLRIPGYNYGMPEDSAVTRFFEEAAPLIIARESIAELMAGCFVPDCGGDEGMAEDTGEKRNVPGSNPRAFGCLRLKRAA
jgi:hypothetical protein